MSQQRWLGSTPLVPNMSKFNVLVICFASIIRGNALKFDHCTKQDSYFAKSKQGWKVEADLWSDSFPVNTGMECPSRCHHNPDCQSAAYHLDTKMCRLTDTSRMDVNAYVSVSPRIVFYERKKCPVKWSFIALVPKVKDCKGIRDEGWATSGVYGIEGPLRDTARILCDMSLLGGGWSVIQQRVDGSLSFSRNWTDYKEGFGSLGGNFWYGNERIHNMTWFSDAANEILLELVDANGKTYYLLYDEFKVASEDNSYKLQVGQYSNSEIGEPITVSGRGPIGLDIHDGMKFSTPDRDNDGHDEEHCALVKDGGWWYNKCFHIDLNGIYLPEKTTSWKGILWEYHYDSTISAYTTHMVSTRMLIRQK